MIKVTNITTAIMIMNYNYTNDIENPIESIKISIKDI